ncbi:MAG: hypothetical protein K0S67_316 [Nitrososphaeraceae archaeon]|nr:hypothetical protein [Nitrososphaeraceae archaeon]
MTNDHANSNDGKKALIIAVSDYDNSSGLKSIEFCKNDGKEMYDILKKNGYDIPDNRKLISYVDSHRLKNAIYNFFTNEDNKPDDTLVFYYSGHGIPDKFGTTFLAPSDMDSDHPFMTGFSFDDLTNSMLACNSLRVVTILDSCFSGSLKISKGLDSKSGEEAATRIANNILEEKSDKLKQGVGRCLLAASQGYEEAYDRQEKDHSIFTYYVLEGLKGHKNAVDDEGNVTYDTLGKFITREIGNLPPEKRPKQTPVRKGEVSGGEIVLANYPDLKKTRESDYYTLFGKGEDYYRRGKYHEALECYNSILKLQPNNEHALLRKGNILVQVNEDKKALECFDEVIKLNKNSSDAWYYKAKLNMKIKDYENALKCLDKASSINPDDERVWDGYKKIKSIMRSDREKEKQEPIISPTEIQKTNVSIIDTLTDKQHPSKGNIYGETQSKPTENIAEQDIKKEEKEKRKYTERDSSNKPSQGIFGSYSKTQEETKVDATTIKSDVGGLQQNKDTLPRSNVNIGAIDGNGAVPSPKYTTASGYDNNERKYTERDRSSQSQGINLKIIIIPIIAIAIIGLIISISYFNGLAPADENRQTVTPPNNTQPKTIPETKISDDANDLISKGTDVYDLGKYQEALEYYDKALAIDPNYDVALYSKGSALSKLGKDQEALEWYDKALAIDPNYVAALNNKGTSLDDLGNYQEAIEWFDKALAIDPNYVSTLISKGWTLYTLGKYQEALEYFDKALAIDPNNGNALNGRSSTQQFTSLNGVTPPNNTQPKTIPETKISDDVTDLNIKSVGFFNQGKYQEAMEWSDKALAIDPNHVNALNNKGNALYGLGNYQEAMEWYDKALAIDPNNVIALNGKGNVLDGLGNYQEAIEWFDKALAIDPNHVSALYNKGSTLSDLGNYQEAIEWYDKALAIDPNKVNALKAKSIALSNLPG